MGQRIPVTLGNIAPLSLRPFQPGRIALVCEGGGQRGIFTAGVLDEFMRAQFNPFDLYLGTICRGAEPLGVYLQSARLRAQSHHALYHKTRIFDHLRFVRGGNLIDLDWLVEATASQMPCKWIPPRGCLTAANRFMCACRQDDYAPITFYQTKQNWLDVIRASSAIPGFYRSGVSLEGINYLDGGISDAIPVKESGNGRR